MHRSCFVESLKSDLVYPNDFQGLFEGICEADQIGQILENKDSLVRDTIDSCALNLEGAFTVNDLIEKGFISKIGVEEILVKTAFSLEGSLAGHGITIDGPVYLGQNAVIGRSGIFGPACVSESCRIHDSQLRGGKTGSVFIGRNCSLWDFTVIIRSWVGHDSLIHTCNIDDSILGPECRFGATRTFGEYRYLERSSLVADATRLDRRIVLCNFSNGSEIRVYDPCNDMLWQIGKEHFGAIVGANVRLGCGTIVYPGTIIGADSKINSAIPVVGYVPPKQEYSLFLSMKTNGKIQPKIQIKGI